MPEKFNTNTTTDILRTFEAYTVKLEESAEALLLTCLLTWETRAINAQRYLIG